MKSIVGLVQADCAAESVTTARWGTGDPMVFAEGEVDATCGTNSRGLTPSANVPNVWEGAAP